MFDVVVIGCGPTGGVLANLLGQLGVRVAVLERAREVHPIPRATHIDEETLRNFQATGLMSALEPHTEPFGKVEIVDPKLVMTLTVEEPRASHGYRGSRFFDQPAFERVLREGLGRHPSVELHVGVEAERIEEDADGVTVHARVGGEARSFRAAWVVGSEGGRSLCRSHIEGSAPGDPDMEAIAERWPWLIIDTRLRDAADVSALPSCFRYELHHPRLTLFAKGFGLNRRWEFELRPDEPIPATDAARAWLDPFIESSRVEIVRVTRYWHYALLARRWRKGRVLIAGDSAHMMPPAAGQGLCSGVRDALNLAWKLDRVVRGQASDALLDTYQAERSPHVRRLLESSVLIGRIVRAHSRFARLRRGLIVRVVGRFAWLAEQVRRRAASAGRLREGFVDPRSRWAGAHLPQTIANGQKTDDGLGYTFVLIGGDASWAEQNGVARRAPPELVAWMKRHRLDYALVRPDRVLFSAGPTRAWPAAKEAFERWRQGS